MFSRVEVTFEWEHDAICMRMLSAFLRQVHIPSKMVN